MAAPVVDNVTPANVTLSPGQYADVTITAHDPDSGSGGADVVITDGAGNKTTAHVAIVIADPITFGAATVTGLAGVTCTRITPAGQSPATYRIQA